MGAWGTGVFENDEVVDFASDVAKTKSLDKVMQAIGDVLSVVGYLEASTASEGIAAADIVARLRGSFGQMDTYTATIDEWAKSMKQLPGDETVARALAVVDRVRTEPSELLELWSEGDASEWLSSLDALKTRLSNLPSAERRTPGLISRIFGGNRG